MNVTAARHVARAEALVDRWRIDGVPAVERFEQLLGSGPGRAGRNRTLPVRTLLVGRVLLADTLATGNDSPQLVNRLHRLLTDLHPKVRHRLGISWTGPDGTERTVTARQVRYLWARIVEVVDPSEHFGGADLDADARAERARLLQAAVDGLLDATHPDDVDHDGSYALDSTYLPSWAKPYWKRGPVRPTSPTSSSRGSGDGSDVDAAGTVIGDADLDADARRLWRLPSDRLTPAQRAARTRDPDARHRWMQRRSRTNGKWLPPKADVFGYQLTIAVRIPEDGGGAVPALVERLLLRPANHGEAEAAVTILEGLVDAGQPLSDVVADRGFTYRRPDVFALPVRALGGRLVIDLHTLQRGTHGTAAGGAIWIDGWPHSPGTPEALWELEPPMPGDSWATIDAKLAAYESRAAFALDRKVADDGRGGQRFQCPAEGRGREGSVICPLKPASMVRDPVRNVEVHDHPDEALPLPTICTQRSVTIPYVAAEQAWVRQKHYYGSYAWYESFKRRNVVEGVFGHLKNEAGEHLKRGNVRAFGLAENTLLVAFVVAAQNLRMLDTFRDRYGTATSRPVGEFEVGPYDASAAGRLYASGRKQRPATTIAEMRQRGHRVRCGETV